MSKENRVKGVRGGAGSICLPPSHCGMKNCRTVKSSESPLAPTGATRRGALRHRPTSTTSAAGPEPAPAGQAASQPEPELKTVAVKIEEPQAKASKDAAQLDTIEVTASQRMKTQRDRPGGAGAVRGQDLETMTAQGLRDYRNVLPGCVVASLGN